MNAEALTTIAPVLALAGLYVFFPLTYAVYARHRRRSLLPCPETGEMVWARIDAGRARVAAPALLPRRMGCAQGCLNKLA